MIRKLLFVFSIVLGTVGVAWGQGATTTNVSTVAELRAAIESATSGDIINLAAGTYQFESELSISKPITLSGAGEATILTATGEWADVGNYQKNLITITSSHVTIKNLTVTGSKRNGVNVYQATGVVVENVWIEKSYLVGLVVNGSKVEAKGLKTSENRGSYAGQVGVEVSVGSGVTDDTEFKFDAACTFAEQAQITAEVKTGINITVTPPAGATWGYGGSASKTVYTNRIKTIGGKLLAVVNNAKELDAAFKAHQAAVKTNLEGIYLAEGIYTQAAAVSIQKDILLVGVGRDKTTINGHYVVTTTAGVVSFEATDITFIGNKNVDTTKGIIGITGTNVGKVKLTDCKISTGALQLGAAATGVRMEPKGAELTLENTDIDARYYGVGVRNEEQKVTINGGTITGWAALMTTASGLATGDGTLADTKTTIAIKNGATLKGRSISDEGYGAIVLQEKYNGVTLTIDGSTVIATDETGAEGLTTAIKQLSALDIRSYGNKVTVSNSTLSAQYGENALEAAVVSLGWHSADFCKESGNYPVKDKSTPATNTITITGGTITGKAGEKLVTTYRAAGNQEHDKLTMNNTSYSVGAGNVYRNYQQKDDGTIVDDAGQPIAIDGASLIKQIADAQAGATVKLYRNITLPKITGLYGLPINKAITLDGNGYTLKAASDFEGYLITVDQGSNNPANVKIQNIVLDNAGKAKGLNIYGSKDVTLSIVSSINSAGAGVVVNNSTVTATDLNTSGNAWGGVNVDKGTPKFTFVSGLLSDAYPIYSELSDTAGIVVAPAGWEGTKIEGKTVWKKARAIPQLVAPTVGATAEAGKTVLAYLLTGGKATVGGKEIAGVFAWANPDTIVKAGVKSYAVLFTPTDLATYATATTHATFGEIKQYVAITIGKCANGKVEIQNANPDNRYEVNKPITLRTIPESENYTFKAWGADITVGEGNTYTPTAPKELTATFVAVMQKVTIQSAGAGGVYVDGTKKENNATVSVAKGSSISVTTIADAGNVLDTLNCSDGKKVSSGTVVVDKDFTITAKFKALPAEMFAVNVASNITNGKILLFDAKNAAVAPGKAVDKDAVLHVIAVPDKGYGIDAALSASGSTLQNGTCTIGAATTFSCSFKPISYSVTAVDPTGGTITVGEVSRMTSKSSTDYPFGTELTVTVAENEGYRLLSLVVNGKEIPNKGTFKVAAATTIQATMRKLVDVVIDQTAQEFLYDGTAKKFVVKTTPAGLGGFTVTYNETPLNAVNHTRKAYNVTITRAADNTYAAVNMSIANGLVVLAADPEGVAIPTASNGTIDNNSGTLYAWKSDIGELPIAIAVYTPANASLKKAEFSIPTGKGTAVQVAYEWKNATTYSTRKVATKAEASSLRVEGDISLWNGTTQLTSGNLYATQVINLKATIPSGYSEEVQWTINGVATTSATASITLTEGANSVSAAFIKKNPATFPGMDNLARTYDGTIFGNAASAPSVKVGSVVSDNWQIEFQRGGKAISEPTEAGSYDIVVSRQSDSKYEAVKAVTISEKLVIAPKMATIGTLSATPVLKGQTLAQSVVSGAVDVDGVFSWATPDAVADGKAQTVVFTPTSSNHKAPSEALKATAQVTEIGDVVLHTLSLTETGGDKGAPVVMTLNGATATSGALVESGDKLAVTFKATASNYSASATINGAAYASGTEYEVKVAGNVAVVITYTYQGGGGGTPEVPSIDVTGVSLNATTKSLAVGAEFALVATVAPAGATNKSVTWASSDPTIATVDANGKMKALKAGICKITVTTDDGGFAATCDVTVSVPTGIDEILANTRVYTEGGAICIAPARPVDVVVVNMTGVALYSGQVTDTYRVPASSGVYLVKLSDGRKEALVKVFVR